MMQLKNTESCMNFQGAKMLQDLDVTIEKLGEIREEVQNGDIFVPRVYDTVLKYASEVIRDLKETEWRNQFQGGLNAGYILCLTGEMEKGVDFLEKSLQIHQANMGEYDKPRSSVLEFVVETLQEFDAEQTVVDRYKSRLKEAQEQETDKPEDLRRKIVHIEADMECATGDLDELYSHGRREEGLLYQRLGEHEKAIEHFQKSMEEDKRDWNKETSIKNRLSIVDSYLATGNNTDAVEEFMGLMRLLGPDELKLGDKIPVLFTDNFSEFAPYFKRLGIEENLEEVAKYARARLDNLKKSVKPPSKKEDPKEHWERVEASDLSEILASHYAARGKYQEALNIFNEGEDLPYKNHLSRREHAEFAIRAGNEEKARQLIKGDETEKGLYGRDDDEIFELVNLHLQLGDVDTALDRLDSYCEIHKRCLVSGTYSSIFETRQTQIAILKAVIGDDCIQKTREYARKRDDLFPKNDLKFLPGNTKDKQA